MFHNTEEEKIEDIEYLDKTRNFIIEIYKKEPEIINKINLDDVINESIMSKIIFFYYNLDSIESLLLNLVNDNNQYGAQIAKRIWKDITKRKKEYTPKMKKYKLFR